MDTQILTLSTTRAPAARWSTCDRRGPGGPGGIVRCTASRARRALARGLAIIVAAGLAGCSGRGGWDGGDVFGGGGSGSSTTPSDRAPAGSGPTPTLGTDGTLAGIPRVVVPAVAGEPDVRVRLLAGVNTVSLSSATKALWVTAAGSGRAPARMSTPVSAQLTAAGWELTDAARLIARFDRQAIIEIAGDDAQLRAPGEAGAGGVSGRGGAAGGAGGVPGLNQSPAGMVMVNGRAYPGVIRLTPRSDVSTRAFDVVETVALEVYLQGVVAAEMFANWPIDAYRAQAVAARSYAIHERARARRSGSAFDLEGSVKDQAYAGATGNLAAERAVRETRGAVVTWQGDVLRTYYHSTCGGRAASARDTWPTGAGFDFNTMGPLQGQNRDHACQGATYYRWQTARSRAELVQRFRQFGRESGTPLRNLTSLDSIRAAGVNAAGRPSRFLVMQPGGQTYTVTAEELRRAANTEVGSLPPVTSQTRVHSGDFDVVAVGDRVTFTGRGFGHGVGLCQWCAKGFADKGESWQSILMRMYPGTRIERVY